MLKNIVKELNEPLFYGPEQVLQKSNRVGFNFFVSLHGFRNNVVHHVERELHDDQNHLYHDADDLDNKSEQPPDRFPEFCQDSLESRNWMCQVLNTERV